MIASTTPAGHIGTPVPQDIQASGEQLRLAVRDPYGIPAAHGDRATDRAAPGTSKITYRHACIILQRHLHVNNLLLTRLHVIWVRAPQVLDGDP